MHGDMGSHRLGCVEHRLRPVNSMRVWDGLSGALLDFDSADLSDAAGSSSRISVMVEISNLQQAMLRFLEQGPGKDVCAVKDKALVESIAGIKYGCSRTLKLRNELTSKSKEVFCP